MTVARIVAVGILLLVLPVGCGGSSKNEGFLDHTRLEAKVQEQANAALSDPGNDAGYPAGTTVENVFCIKSTESDRKFDCKINLSNGDGETVKLLVSEDGSGFVPVDK